MNCPDDALPYELDLSYSDSPAVGVVVLQSDETLENELRITLDFERLRLFHSRIPMQTEVTPETLLEMEHRLLDAVKLFPAQTPLSVIAFACTSAATLMGEARLEALIRQQHPAARITNPLTAIKARLNALGAKKIGLLTPYLPSITAPMAEDLVASGFAVQTTFSFNQPNDHKVAQISRSSLENGLQQLKAASRCDALVVSCTNLKTLPWLPSFANQMGCPVVSSNSALIWHIQALSRGAPFV